MVCSNTVFKHGVSFGFGAAVFLFPACLKIHFDRHRYFMHHYFEVLVPSTAPDAREIDTFLPPHSSMLVCRISSRQPGMSTTGTLVGTHCENTLSISAGEWSFSWSLPHSVDGYVHLRVRVDDHRGQFRGHSPVTTALIIELYMAVVLCIGGLQIIRTGMRANRQIKLHKSAIEHYRTRLAGHIEDQTSTMRDAGFDDAAITARVGSVKALQTALKHVANELDAEGDSEKLRINGFPVDARMAEGIVTLLGSVGVTIYQVVMGGRAWMS